MTDELGFIESGLEDYIIDRTTGRQYPIRAFRNWQETAYINGEPNLELLVSALLQAKQIFLMPNYSTVVVLMPNFVTNPERNFTFDQSDFPNWSPSRIEQFLQENKVVYETVRTNYPHEVLSPDQRLIARDDGIYLVETNRLIAKAPSLLVMGWDSNGRGAIYSSLRGLCLIRIGLPFSDDTGCKIWVPQPVIKLRVPEEY